MMRSRASLFFALVGLGCSSPTSNGLILDGGVVVGGDAPVGGDTGPAATPAYAACTAGASCGGGTVCNAASFTSDGRTANLCTAACAQGTDCPPGASATAPTCVFNASTGTGQCYGTCETNADCADRTICAMIAGTANRICVPAATAPATPPPAYTACAPAGGACGDGATCAASVFARAGAAAGNVCTLACTSGNAAMCPGYVAGAAIQSVECAAPMGNPAAAQCVRLCDPANGNRDCAPYLTTCAVVQMAAGMLSICVP